MSASRTERLLNLLIALLETRYGRSKEFLRQNIQAYRESPSEEAFERMFERDKVDLRSMGIPLEARTIPGAFEEDPASTHYRIPKDKYRLPQIRFSVEEAAVLSLATRLWGRATLGSAAVRAVRKIHTRGGLPDIAEEEAASEELLEPRVIIREPAFEELLEAVTTRQRVRFDYLGANDDVAKTRTMMPWGIGQKYGHWYVVGHDIDRNAQRVFRLSRILGAIHCVAGSTFERPEGFSVNEVLDRMQLPSTFEAEVAVRSGHGHSLRERAELIDARDVPRKIPEGWDLLRISYGSQASMAGELATWGRHVVVQEPQALREAVIERYQETIAAFSAPAPQIPQSSEPHSMQRIKIIFVTSI